MNSKGKELIPGKLIMEVVENLLLPAEISVTHVNGHQKENSYEATGHRILMQLLKRLYLKMKLDF